MYAVKGKAASQSKADTNILTVTSCKKTKPLYKSRQQWNAWPRSQRVGYCNQNRLIKCPTIMSVLDGNLTSTTVVKFDLNQRLQEFPALMCSLKHLSEK